MSRKWKGDDIAQINGIGQITVSGKYNVPLQRDKLLAYGQVNGVLETIGIAANWIERKVLSHEDDPTAPAQLRPCPEWEPKQIRPEWLLLSCPFFYNDFGLTYTLKNQYTAKVWYDWSWNYQSINGYNGQGYYPDRHPAIGWFHGDDPLALSWLVYDLLEAGHNGVILQQRSNLPTDHSSGTWDQPTSILHWVYQMFTNVKNIGPGKMQLALWLPQTDSPATDAQGTGSTSKYRPNTVTWTQSSSGGWSPSGGNWLFTTEGGIQISTQPYASGSTVRNSVSDNRLYRVIEGHTAIAGTRAPHINTADWEPVPLESEWNQLGQFYIDHYEKILTVTFQSKRLALFYIHDVQVLASDSSGIGRGTYRAWLRALSEKLKISGHWDGVLIQQRNSLSPSTSGGVTYPTGQLNYDSAWVDDGVYLLRGDYEGIDASNAETLKPFGQRSYKGLIDNFGTFSAVSKEWGAERRAYTIPTSLVTLPPHSSTFNYQGHAPALFQMFTTKVLKKIRADNSFPGVFFYNVMEPAEGGPGLFINMQDGPGYLNATRDAYSLAKVY